MHHINLFGYEIYGGAICAVAEFDMNDFKVTTWIDRGKGTALKTITSGIDYSKKEYEIKNEYKITYGVVTDEDVARPDLTGYTEIVEE